jgi:hypothetical protein
VVESNMNKDKLLDDLKRVYSEIYSLERVRVGINKKIKIRKQHLYAVLNYLRMEK